MTLLVRACRFWAVQTLVRDPQVFLIHKIFRVLSLIPLIISALLLRMSEERVLAASYRLRPRQREAITLRALPQYRMLVILQHKAAVRIRRILSIQRRSFQPSIMTLMLGM